jgi:hypothetical protein
MNISEKELARKVSWAVESKECEGNRALAAIVSRGGR